ncbi:MAG: ABC transporter permease, partial [Phycisphaerae bacterium]
MIRPRRGIPRRAAGWFAAAASRNIQNVVTALIQIAANKGRSILTTLGIIIAVTSTITVISVVQGFGRYMTDMVQGYGTQFMVVHPWTPAAHRRAGMRRVTLDMADIRAVRIECPDVDRITPFVYTSDAEIAYGAERTRDIPVRGVTEHYQTIRNFFVDAGRFFGPVDVETAANVVVLGRSVVTQLQSDDAIVGDIVLLDGTRFLVAGLLAPKGSVMGDDQDKTVMIPYTTALNMYPELRTAIPFLAEAATEDDIDDAAAQITRVLRRRHGLQPGQPDDFRIDRQDQTLQEFQKLRNVVSGVLAGIVSISLVVGGIGIMNIMLVSVTERTREIGLRKSVGGRRRDVMMQFLTEAVVLCTIGGALGVTLYHAVFGFTSAWRALIADARGEGVRAQMLMLGLAT